MLRMSFLLLLFGITASAQHTTFTLASTGCPMAHCSNFAGSQDAVAPPQTLTNQTSDTDTGMSKGVGCVSNGTLVACTYKTGPDVCDGRLEPGNFLTIYSYSGGAVTKLYESGCIFDNTAWESVPMMNGDGDVIMSDDHVIARFSYVDGSYPANGSATWCTSMPASGTPASLGACSGSDTSSITAGGASISPTLLANNTVVAVATASPGWIYTFWADTGYPITSQAIQVEGDCSVGSDSCYYETANTPAASYNTLLFGSAALDSYFPISVDSSGNVTVVTALRAGHDQWSIGGFATMGALGN
jgi:hypothetical protein